MCIHVQLSVSHALYLVSSLPSSLTISLLSSHPTPPKAASGHEKFYRCELADLVWLAFSVFVHVCVCVCVCWQTLRPVSVSLCQTRVLATCRPLISLPPPSLSHPLTHTPQMHTYTNLETVEKSQFRNLN